VSTEGGPVDGDRGASGRSEGGDRAVGTASEGRPWALAGLVLAGLGLAMFPIGGLVGIVCGGIARSKGEQRLGLVTIVASVISFVASFFVAAWVIG
jgi:hypothetical protein